MVLALPGMASEGSGMRSNMPPGTPTARPDPSNSLHSSLRASILEHIFIGELGRALWCAGVRNFEVLRSEVDAYGHDLVVECSGIVRHIQLKSSHEGSHVAEVTLSLDLQQKNCGCVIWLEFDERMKIVSYRWFGGIPGEPLPSLGDKIATHTRGRKIAEGGPIRSPRPNHRVVKKSRFTRFEQIDQLLCAMFGPLPSASGR